MFFIMQHFVYISTRRDTDFWNFKCKYRLKKKKGPKGKWQVTEK